MISAVLSETIEETSCIFQVYGFRNCIEFYSGYIEKNEMGGARGTCGERERCAQGFGGET